MHGKRSAQHRHQWSSTNQLSRFHRNQSPLILHGTHTTTHSPQCPLTFSFPFPHFSPLPFTSRTVLKSTHRPSQCHSCPLTHHDSSANCSDSSTSTSTNCPAAQSLNLLHADDHATHQRTRATSSHGCSASSHFATEPVLRFDDVAHISHRTENSFKYHRVGIVFLASIIPHSKSVPLSDLRRFSHSSLYTKGSARRR